MSFSDRPWAWAAGLLLSIVLIAFVVGRRPAGRSHRHRSENGSGAGSGSGAEGGYRTEPTQSGEQRALFTAANQLRDALEKQTRQMEELRTFWSRRLDDLERKITATSTVRPSDRDRAPDTQPGAGYGGYAAGFDSGTYGAESLGWQLPSAEPAWSPGPADQPVEVRDGVLVVSRSLPPAGYVSAAGSGQARVYLNAEVPLTEFSLPKWAEFFDLQGARPYAAYRTRRPAEVRWDEGSGRGELVSKGLAEAI